MSEDIIIVSGFKQGGGDIKAATQKGRNLAVKKSVVATIARLLPKAAKKTGRFRKGIEKDFDQQLLQQIVGKGMRIELRRNMIVAVDPNTGHNYAIHHINPGGNYGSFYFRPTTPGTSPVESTEWNNSLRSEFAARIIPELTRQGLEVSRG